VEVFACQSKAFRVQDFEFTDERELLLENVSEGLSTKKRSPSRPLRRMKLMTHPSNEEEHVDQEEN
jgi:hypothetical protein